MNSINDVNVKYKHNFVFYDLDSIDNINNVFICKKCQYIIYTGNYHPYWLTSKNFMKYKNAIQIDKLNLTCEEIIIKRLLE